VFTFKRGEHLDCFAIEENTQKKPQAQFLKIYRSTLINISFLEWVNHATLRLKNGTELKISRIYKEAILTRFKK